MFRILSPKNLGTMRLCRLVSTEPAVKHMNDILRTHLKISDNTLSKIKTYHMDTIISKIPSKQIIVNCQTMQSMGVNLEDTAYLSHCLKLKPLILKNRICVLKQMGVKSVGLRNIYRFLELMRKSIKAFKAEHNISMKESIMKNMFANVGISIDDITAAAMEYKYKARVGVYYQKCVVHYTEVYLKLGKELSQIRKVKYQSFEQITEQIQILKKECKLPTKFLKKHPQLLQVNGDNIREFLVMGKYAPLYGRNVRDVIKMYPCILRWHVSEVKEILQLKKALGIESSGLFISIRVLRMNKTKFLERYINITNNHELSLWSQHSSMLTMIFRYNFIMNRLQYLKHLKCINKANGHTYRSSGKFFTRFVEGDVDRFAVKACFKYLLCKELGERNGSLIDSLVRHPHWKLVPLLCARDTLQYLKEHFTVEDICRNIQIILYGRSKIISELNLVKRKVGETGYDFTGNQHLAVCLYQLEKKCHFSGDGIWETVDTEISDYKSNCSEDEEENVRYLEM